METKIVYCDETGDDGQNTKSSDIFVLTSVYMPSSAWNDNYNKVKELRKELKSNYGMYVKEEMHTKQFLTDKDPYRKYNWDVESKREIIEEFTKNIASLDLRIINVIIDKTKITKGEYNVLENALKYSIQRIENDSSGDWNFAIISDKGRIAPMRKTARTIRQYNPIQSQYSSRFINKPIKNMVEDVLEKDSKESFFIQIADFVSYFVHLYYSRVILKKDFPKRVAKVIDIAFVKRVLETLKIDKLNLDANKRSVYGFVVYPK